MKKISITAITRNPKGKYGHINIVGHATDSSKGGQLQLERPDNPSCKDYMCKIATMLEEITMMANQNDLTIISHSHVIF